jgi:hypothetical protein
MGQIHRKPKMSSKPVVKDFVYLKGSLGTNPEVVERNKVREIRSSLNTPVREFSSLFVL